MKNKTLLERLYHLPGTSPETPENVDLQTFWEVAKETNVRGYDVLRRLFNADGSPSGKTLKQVSVEMGISASRVQQLRDRILRMMKHKDRRERYVRP